MEKSLEVARALAEKVHAEGKFKEDSIHAQSSVIHESETSNRKRWLNIKQIRCCKEQLTKQISKYKIIHVTVFRKALKGAGTNV